MNKNTSRAIENTEALVQAINEFGDLQKQGEDIKSKLKGLRASIDDAMRRLNFSEYKTKHYLCKMAHGEPSCRAGLGKTEADLVKALDEHGLEKFTAIVSDRESIKKELIEHPFSKTAAKLEECSFYLTSTANTNVKVTPLAKPKLKKGKQ